MTIADTTQQFISGLQNIEKSIITGMRENGIAITSNHFQWHRGKEFVPPPETISLEIKFQGKSTNAILSKEQIQDSWERISRPDVSVIIKQLVAHMNN